MQNENHITNPYEALELLKKHNLISISLMNGKRISSIYILKVDNIQVINDNSSYYITKDKFTSDFNLSKFYIYKPNYNDVEIDQEFHKLRQ